MKRIVIPAALTLAVVVAYVGAAGWNRGGPRRVITLTERELGIPWRGPGDDATLVLRLQTQGRDEPLDARNWLTQDRLRELGFAVDFPVGNAEAADRYNRALPRLAWIAYEYAGAAWEDIARQPQGSTPPSLRPGAGAVEPSRLVPVDAAADAEPLRARYPQHLIVRGVIDLVFVGAPKGPMIYGRVREIVPPEITVPAGLRAELSKLRPHALVAQRPEEATPEPPRYEVDIAVGRLGVPYVVAVRRLGVL